MNDEDLLAQQVAYYRARAGEYDQWFLRQGRYDRGPEERARWFGEVAEVESVLRANVHDVDVLELACGTGLWTERLLANNNRVLAVDASPEVMALNRARNESAGGRVEYVVADIFSSIPASRAFDAVFFSFWLSHVPAWRFDKFWESVRAALKPGGQAFFIDSLFGPMSTAHDHDPIDESGVVRRKLNDGQQYEIVKIFYEPAELEAKLRQQGFGGWVRSTGTYFLYGSMTRI